MGQRIFGSGFNRAAGPLSAGLDSGGLSVTLQSGYGALFPALAAGEFFYAVIQKGPLDGDVREYVKVTARASDTLTIVRAQGGSTAQTFATGDIMAMVVLAEDLDGFVTRDSETVLASAFTTDLGSSRTEDVEITGTTNISNFGTSAPTGSLRNLRFTNASPGALIDGGGVTPGSILCLGGAKMNLQQGDVVTVRKLASGFWLAVGFQPAYNAQIWEKIADWVPTSVNTVSFLWNPARYKAVRVIGGSLKAVGTGYATSDLYARVYQASAIKAGGADYFMQGARWQPGTIDTGTVGYMPITRNGQNTTPEELSFDVTLSCPFGAQRGGMMGMSRYLDSSSSRVVNVFGHQILAADAAINGVLIGWVGATANFVASSGFITLEGLRR